MSTYTDNGLTYSGAGVLVMEDYCEKNGEVIPCVLLVRNAASKSYMDFGGAYEKKHNNLQTTASLELREESRNLFNVSTKYFVDADAINIPSRLHLYRSYIIKINNVSRKHFLHNKRVMDKASAFGTNVPRCWRETDKIAHVPISNINFIRLGNRGSVILSDINGEKIELHPRTKRVLYHHQDTMNKKIEEPAIGDKKNVVRDLSPDFKNDTFSFIIN